jgi:hypothetical protein
MRTSLTKQVATMCKKGYTKTESQSSNVSSLLYQTSAPKTSAKVGLRIHMRSVSDWSIRTSYSQKCAVSREDVVRCQRDQDVVRHQQDHPSEATRLMSKRDECALARACNSKVNKFVALVTNARLKHAGCVVLNPHCCHPFPVQDLREHVNEWNSV